MLMQQRQKQQADVRDATTSTLAAAAAADDDDDKDDSDSRNTAVALRMVKDVISAVMSLLDRQQTAQQRLVDSIREVCIYTACLTAPAGVVLSLPLPAGREATNNLQRWGHNMNSVRFPGRWRFVV